jgi:hypothetical protein
VIIFSAGFSFGQNCQNYHVVSSGETLFGISKKYRICLISVIHGGERIVTEIK